jgi:ADP-ribose pyrophosphatase YjhB (NUDIX family)
MHHVSVAGVVWNSQLSSVLLVRRRDNGQWQIPGGLLEPDEELEAGLIREIREESGLTIAPRRLSGVYKNVRLHSLALVFVCEAVCGQMTLRTDETADAGWYSRSQALTMCDHMFGIRIVDALDGGPTPMIRTHDGIQVLKTILDSSVS